MSLNIEMGFWIIYPFMNIEHMIFQKNDTNTIG